MNLHFNISDRCHGDVPVSCIIPDHIYAAIQAGRIKGDRVVFRDTTSPLRQCKLIINGRCKYIVHFNAAGADLFGMTSQCARKLAELLKVSANVQEMPDRYGTSSIENPGQTLNSVTRTYHNT